MNKNPSDDLESTLEVLDNLFTLKNDIQEKAPVDSAIKDLLAVQETLNINIRKAEQTFLLQRISVHLENYFLKEQSPEDTLECIRKFVVYELQRSTEF